MKDFIDINKIVGEIQKKDVRSWFDKLTFIHILTIWVSIVIFFGLIYYFFAGDTSNLFYSRDGKAISKITDAIYFSFVTATTTGFGDITPIGKFKLISIFEVIFGLLLLAFVTSKLVSIKQDMILNEVYDLSFSEKINRLRSSLLLFRQNLSRIATKIEDGTIKKREVAEVYMYISSFEDTLNEVVTLTEKKDNRFFTKRIDPINTELILNSILSSFEKINEMISIMNQHKIEWRRDLTLTLIDKCILVNEDIFNTITSSKRISEKNMNGLNTQKKQVITNLKSCLGPGPDECKPVTTIITE